MPVNTALEKLKEASKGTDIESIKKCTEELNLAWSKVSEKVYQQQSQENTSDNSTENSSTENTSDDNIEDADLVVLNTCHIREKATEKVYHEIGRVKKDFKNFKKPLVIVSGCVAQAEGEERDRRDQFDGERREIQARHVGDGARWSHRRVVLC